ncbi:putative rhomboid protein 2 [Naviculisporaceae sp. PSN 640]
MPTIASLNTGRARAYVFRIPLFTRATILIIAAAWLLGLQRVWDVRAWGALIPDKVSIATLYRINTFPFIHLNIIHAVLNVIALTPLLERFESEHGTLTSLALFFGPFVTAPGLMYVLIERYILGGNVGVMGASMWVFLLLGVEAIRTYRVNPTFAISTYNIPTWTTPIFLMFAIWVLVPGSSFLGHFCGLVVGYGFGLGYLKFLAPPEKILRWVEGKLNLLGRLPHYVSVDQKTYGRFGVLPTSGGPGSPGPSVAMGIVGGGQRLGP